MPGETSGEVRLAGARKPLRSTVNGPLSSDKSILYLEDLQCQSANAGQSGSDWPVLPSTRPVLLRGEGAAW